MQKICVECESVIFYLLEVYCSSKSWIWNLFFGWRKTISTTNGQLSYYIINSREYEQLRFIARDLEASFEKISKTPLTNP